MVIAPTECPKLAMVILLVCWSITWYLCILPAEKSAELGSRQYQTAGEGKPDCLYT